MRACLESGLGVRVGVYRAQEERIKKVQEEDEKLKAQYVADGMSEEEAEAKVKEERKAKVEAEVRGWACRLPSTSAQMPDENGRR